MTRRHLPSPKSSLRMFARLDERGIDDAMAFTRGAGSWSTQVAEAVDGDTFVEYGTSQNTPRHAYSAALGRRGFLMEPTRTNRQIIPNFADAAPADGSPDGWDAGSGVALTDFDTVAGGPHGGTVFRLLNTATVARGVVDQITGAPGVYTTSMWVRHTVAAVGGSIYGHYSTAEDWCYITVPAELFDWRRLHVTGPAITVGLEYCGMRGLTQSCGVVSMVLPQTELGSYPTSPIPANGPATRAAELCAIDSALIASDGVLELEYVPQFDSTDFSTSDTIWTWANGWRLDYDGSDDAIHLIVNGNSEIESAALAFVADTKYELQVRWGQWGTALSVNGVVLRDGTAWGTPTPAAYLGSGAASAQCEAKIFGDVRIAR